MSGGWGFNGVLRVQEYTLVLGRNDLSEYRLLWSVAPMARCDPAQIETFCAAKFIPEGGVDQSNESKSFEILTFCSGSMEAKFQ